jgi:aspartate aminotransferase-like enzyme
METSMTTHRVPLTFKLATEPWEFEQIHRLNHRTFVEEIPQHDPLRDHRLIDRFHDENTYLVVLKGRRLVGMVSVRGRRPFSLDLKLGNIDKYLPTGRSVCEIRLLSIVPEYRHGVILAGLLDLLYDYCQRESYDTAVISATDRKAGLYAHLGFKPFARPVGPVEARFQPMVITKEQFERQSLQRLRWRTSRLKNTDGSNFLPGPVAVHRSVQRAFARPPVSHRATVFCQDFHRTQTLLCDLVHAAHVEIFMGSGTMANDVIAGQLAMSRQRGLILTNGEFGNRLIDHATRFGLTFDTIEARWGAPFDYDAIGQRMSATGPSWLWAAHCETSTGVLNDLERLKTFCREHGARLCLDVISSIGTVPVDLRGVALASGVSGKGLGSLPGLSMVFYHDPVAASASLPRYLDLGYYAAHEGIPFTVSSNLVFALQSALMTRRWNDSNARITALSKWLRTELRMMGLNLVAPEACASPAVITIALPPWQSSEEAGTFMERRGFLLSYYSGYLLARNWIQICLMGHCSRPALERLLDAWQCYVAETARVSPSGYSRLRNSRCATGAGHPIVAKN